MRIKATQLHCSALQYFISSDWQIPRALAHYESHFPDTCKPN